MTGDIHPIVVFLIFFSGWILGATYRNECWRWWLVAHLRFPKEELHRVEPPWDIRKWKR